MEDEEMSLRENIEFNCPSCHTSQTVEVWRSINTTENPELKKDLFEGRINIFHCLECDFEGSLPVDLLYHDMENHFCIQFFPFEWTLDDHFLQRFYFKNGEIIQKFPTTDLNIPLYLQRPHIVFNMNEMIRYIIFLEKVIREERNEE
jgi:Zn ribbon nucleic-acid-binding protein